jgi:hypothetical protein
LGDWMVFFVVLNPVSALFFILHSALFLPVAFPFCLLDNSAAKSFIQE